MLVLTLMISATGGARTLKYVEVGINQSKFRSESCKSKVGTSFQIGFDYFPINSLGAFIGTGLTYQNKKFLLQKRTWPTDFDPKWSTEVVTGDVDINISYLEMPLQIGYSMRIRNQISSSVFAGYSLSIPIKDHTRTKNRVMRGLTHDERGKYDFDYVFLDETGASWSKNFYIGFRLAFNHLALSTVCAKALSPTEDILGWTIQGKIDSYRVSLAYIF